MIIAGLKHLRTLRSLNPVIRSQYASLSLKNDSSIDVLEEYITKASNPTLTKLWNQKYNRDLKPEDDSINALNTLPIRFKTREEINIEVSKANPDSSSTVLKLTQFKEFLKSVIHFYKTGLVNVWKNNKYVKNELGQKYFINYNKGGLTEKRRFNNGKDLIKCILSIQSLTATERESLKTDDTRNLLNITRRELQTIIRTERDFIKIPLFALILLIFEEMTPLLCLLIPEITPSTCTNLSVITKMNSKAQIFWKDLTKLRLEKYGEVYAKGDYPKNLNPWNLGKVELQLLNKALNLTSRYIPISVYSESVLRSKLSDYYDYLKVDSEMLVNDGNFWNLDRRELIHSCIERALIDFEKDKVDVIDEFELRARLMFFLALFNHDKSIKNIGGLLGLNHLGLQDPVHFSTINAHLARSIHEFKLKN